MMERWAAVEPVSTADLGAFDRDVAALAAVDGLVFLDPQDGVHPLHLVHRARSVRPDIGVVLPLVTRDRNRTALLAEARAAAAVGARAVLALAGHVDPGSPARVVYELDPLQVLHLLDDAGVGVAAWVAGRTDTPAQAARAGTLAAAGAVRRLAPWTDGDRASGAPEPVWWVTGDAWRAGRAPATGHCAFQLSPGAGPELAAFLGRSG